MSIYTNRYPSSSILCPPIQSVTRFHPAPLSVWIHPSLLICLSILSAHVHHRSTPTYYLLYIQSRCSLAGWLAGWLAVHGGTSLHCLCQKCEMRPSGCAEFNPMYECSKKRIFGCVCLGSGGFCLFVCLGVCRKKKRLWGGDMQ